MSFGKLFQAILSSKFVLLLNNLYMKLFKFITSVFAIYTCILGKVTIDCLFYIITRSVSPVFLITVNVNLKAIFYMFHINIF